MRLAAALHPKILISDLHPGVNIHLLRTDAPTIQADIHACNAHNTAQDTAISYPTYRCMGDAPLQLRHYNCATSAAASRASDGAALVAVLRGQDAAPTARAGSILRAAWHKRQGRERISRASEGGAAAVACHPQSCHRSRCSAPGGMVAPAVETSNSNDEYDACERVGRPSCAARSAWPRKPVMRALHGEAK